MTKCSCRWALSGVVDDQSAESAVDAQFARGRALAAVESDQDVPRSSMVSRHRWAQRRGYRNRDRQPDTLFVSRATRRFPRPLEPSVPRPSNHLQRKEDTHTADYHKSRRHGWCTVLREDVFKSAAKDLHQQGATAPRVIEAHH